MARLMHQQGEVRTRFEAWVRRKQQAERADSRQRFARAMPLLSGLAPLADLAAGLKQTRNQFQGTVGETGVMLTALLGLPSSWILFNDVVIELDPDTFAQIDHILIGLPGLFLIETKAWDGSFKAYRDSWQWRAGNHWEACSSSPTRQHKRHAQLVQRWLPQQCPHDLPTQPETWIKPLVVFTRAKWLRTTQCSVPVFHGVRALLDHITQQDTHYLTTGQIERLARVLMFPVSP